MDYPSRRYGRFYARQLSARGNLPFRPYGPRRGMAFLKIGLLGTVGYFAAKKLLRFRSQRMQAYFDDSADGDGSNGYKTLGWVST
ncbi:hypothetical protein N7466_006742 [Penicillium verhagenii]|uniref:uncharacterized protein n=1 Tax=Penicillium verhagenii TaxID=1562060 RepID=UPI002545B74F|nr:uncharacterized protein N7466_006742 [Penicillium verhagenii]KAJ5927786.1 hypothetical protein N7466_006742 [Penicillium verhagenii]